MTTCAARDCEREAEGSLYCLSCAQDARATAEELRRRLGRDPLCADCQGEGAP